MNLTNNQLARAHRFNFNLGGGNLNGLLRHGLDAVDRILLFDHVGGKALPGLTRAEPTERALYCMRLTHFF